MGPQTTAPLGGEHAGLLRSCDRDCAEKTAEQTESEDSATHGGLLAGWHYETANHQGSTAAGELKKAPACGVSNKPGALTGALLLGVGGSNIIPDGMIGIGGHWEA